MLLAAAIERLYDLNVGTTPVQEGAPHEKPHKPLLLMAAFDLIDEGLATPDHIPWCQAIRDRFTTRFNLVRKHNDQNNPDLPFRYLAGDGFWAPLEADGVTPVRREIRVSDIGQICARFSQILDPRRSTGEAELLSLAGKSMLLPQDQAFHPAGEGLEWRCKQLIA